MKQNTNFDSYLKEQLKDREFAEHFKKAGKDWDVALQLADLRKKSGLSQKELARRVGTSQQQISRLESPSYEGHSLSMIRRVTEVLGAAIRVTIEPLKPAGPGLMAEKKAPYRVKKINKIAYS
jgi:transcriptional regulator with XRE-family HTH domain